MTAWRAFIFCS